MCDAAETAPRNPKERAVPLVQPDLRLGPENLYRPYRQRGPSRAAMDGLVRGHRLGVRVPLHAPARQLSARGGPGLRARYRAAARWRQHRSHQCGARSDAEPRAQESGCRRRRRGQRFQLPGPRRERRPGVLPIQTVEGAVGQCDRADRATQWRDLRGHQGRAGVRGQPANDQRSRPIRRLRSIPAGPLGRRSPGPD